MKVHSISLDSIRNYDSFSTTFSSGVNIICGENAQGKTNLLEAIEYLSGAHSHRTRTDRDIISFGKDVGIIRANVESRGRVFDIEARLNRGKRKSLSVNHVRLKTAGELSGIVQTVLFCPEDLALIKSGASERRAFLDRAISQLRPRYLEALTQYNRLLDHKMHILKGYDKNPGLLHVMDEFNDAMARAGALVIHYRAHFVRKLGEKASRIHEEFSGGRELLDIRYQTVKTVLNPLDPTVKIYEWLREHQESHKKQEIEAKTCLSGPHKDDIVASICGNNARQFASQGQARTAALSLKLAERELFMDDTGQWPILLLDDVLSELDRSRQDYILRSINGGQVFITGCDIPDDSFPDGRLFIIQQGKLLREI